MSWFGRGDALARQAPAQVKEQADRPEVRPLQVVQHQEQWLPLRQSLQYTGVLLKEVALPHAGHTGVGSWPALHKRAQAGQSASPSCRGAAHKRAYAPARGAR
jgi:hypothetical protein